MRVRLCAYMYIYVDASVTEIVSLSLRVALSVCVCVCDGVRLDFISIHRKGSYKSAPGGCVGGGGGGRRGGWGAGLWVNMKI